MTDFYGFKSMMKVIFHHRVSNIFDGLIICNVYLDIDWLKVHLMYWTFVSTLLIYSAENGIQ